MRAPSGPHRTLRGDSFPGRVIREAELLLPYTGLPIKEEALTHMGSDWLFVRRMRWCIDDIFS